MKNRVLILTAIAAMLSASLAATTYVVKVNADGSFTPAVTFISSGDTVEWRLSGPGDSVIPINWDGLSAGYCSAVKPYSATDLNDLTGPMPLAASGIFTLGPPASGYVVEPRKSTCTLGGQPDAVVGNEMLCHGGSLGASLDSTWQDPSLTGVFKRLKRALQKNSMLGVKQFCFSRRIAKKFGVEIFDILDASRGFHKIRILKLAFRKSCRSSLFF